MAVSLPSYALKWAPGDGPKLMGLLHTPLDVMEMIADKIASPGTTTSVMEALLPPLGGRKSGRSGQADGRKIRSVQCCFTSTETVRTIRDARDKSIKG